MKRVAFLLLSILMCNTPVYGQPHHSQLGFSLIMPSAWEVISKDRITENPGMLDAVFGTEQSGALKDADKDILAHLKALVVTGNIEYYHNRENGALISVLRESGKLDQAPHDIRRACESLPSELMKLMGKHTKVYECELRRMENFNALYTAADGFKEGTKSLQYQIPRFSDELLIITATCRNQDCKSVQKELDQMVSSLKLK